MKRSSERILTTHTGSLPRPDDLADMLFAKESGELGDRAAFDARVRSAVAEVVRKQAEIGVDIVNDGEMGKIGYSTYATRQPSAPRLAPPTWPSFPSSPSARSWGARCRR
jgi:5-methyltetrahydropteroyltriglutamate--homocysteine methyltransferase